MQRRLGAHVGVARALQLSRCKTVGRGRPSGNEAAARHCKQGAAGGQVQHNLPARKLRHILLAACDATAHLAQARKAHGARRGDALKQHHTAALVARS